MKDGNGKLPKLFTPLKLRGVEFQNRIGVSLSNSTYQQLLTGPPALASVPVLCSRRSPYRMAPHSPRRHHPARRRSNHRRGNRRRPRGSHHTRGQRSLEGLTDRAPPKDCRICTLAGTEDWYPARTCRPQSQHGSAVAFHGRCRRQRAERLA
jgi:hypothetical protein